MTEEPVHPRGDRFHGQGDHEGEERSAREARRRLGGRRDERIPTASQTDRVSKMRANPNPKSSIGLSKKMRTPLKRSSL